MSEFIDKKYINMVSGQLGRFKWKSSTLANCRCPICGDSQKNKTKCRGYFYSKSNSFFYRCHNCGFGSSVKNFLQKVAPSLAQEYQMETFNESFSGRKKRKKKVNIEDMNFVPFKTKERGIVNMSSIDLLEKDHPCRKFVEDRKIPEKHFKNLLHAENFNSFARIHVSDSCSYPEEERLVIPFLDEQENVYAAQGRRIADGDTPKYFTAKPESVDKLWYNLYGVNPELPVIVVEGPLDSLFLSNAVALVGAGAIIDLPERIKNSKIIYALDNEPRNPQIVSFYEKLVDAGMSVCLWPSNIKEKDINEMVLAGLNPEEIIMENSYHGLEAVLKIKDWKKI